MKPRPTGRPSAAGIVEQLGPEAALHFADGIIRRAVQALGLPVVPKILAHPRSEASRVVLELARNVRLYQTDRPYFHALDREYTAVLRSLEDEAHPRKGSRR